MGDSYVTATHPALNSVCCYTLGGKPPCLKKKNRPGPSLCPPWAGNIAGVIGDALVMGGAAPILLRFVVPCRPWAWPVRCSGVLVRAQPPVATPVGAGAEGRRGAPCADPAASPLGRDGPFWLEEGVPSPRGGRRTCAPAARRLEGGQGGGGGGRAGRAASPQPPAPWGGPWPPSLSPFVSGAPLSGIHVQSGLPGGRGRRWVSVAGGGERSPRPGPLPSLRQAGTRVDRLVCAFLGAAGPLLVGSG